MSAQHESARALEGALAPAGAADGVAPPSRSRPTWVVGAGGVARGVVVPGCWCGAGAPQAGSRVLLLSPAPDCRHPRLRLGWLPGGGPG